MPMCLRGPMSSSGRLQGVERNRLIDTAPALQPVPRLRRTQKSMRQSSGDSERCSASSDVCRPVDPVHVVDLAFVRRRPIQIQNDGLAAVFVVGDHELPVRQVPMNRGKQGEHLVAGIERVHGFSNGRLGLGLAQAFLPVSARSRTVVPATAPWTKKTPQRLARYRGSHPTRRPQAQRRVHRHPDPTCCPPGPTAHC